MIYGELNALIFKTVGEVSSFAELCSVHTDLTFKIHESFRLRHIAWYEEDDLLDKLNALFCEKFKSIESVMCDKLPF